jgi:hypothetical protein
MTAQNVTIEIAEDDNATKRLARVLLVSEIAVQILACFVVLETLEHGAITYKAQWYWKRWTAKLRAREERDRELHREISRLMFDLYEFENGEQQ